MPYSEPVKTKLQLSRLKSSSLNKIYQLKVYGNQISWLKNYGKSPTWRKIPPRHTPPPILIWIINWWLPYFRFDMYNFQRAEYYLQCNWGQVCYEENFWFVPTNAYLCHFPLSCQTQFDAFARETLRRAAQPIHLPDGGTVYDYMVDPKLGTFMYWADRQMDRTRGLPPTYTLVPEVNCLTAGITSVFLSYVTTPSTRPFSYKKGVLSSGIFFTIIWDQAPESERVALWRGHTTGGPLYRLFDFGNDRCLSSWLDLLTLDLTC